MLEDFPELQERMNQPTDNTARVWLDQWLNVACVCKTRSQERQACQKIRVLVNGRICKPGRPLKVGDRLSIRLGGAHGGRILRVQALSKRSIPRAKTRRLYEDLTPKEPKIDAATKIAMSQPRRLGRPTKKARRNLNRIRGL